MQFSLRAFQLEVIPGHPQINTANILNAISEAKQDGIDLIAFPEMAISGYLLGDEWERQSFVAECVACGEKVRQAAEGITVVFGNIATDPEHKNEDGRIRKYNACFVAENQQFLTHPKTQTPFFIKILMPNYREFDDNRHFFDPRKLAFEQGIDLEELAQPANSQLGRLGCFICEDGWDADYNLSPVKQLAANHADVLLNISASPYTFSKNHKRYRVFSEHAQKHQLPLIYVNAIGLQDNGKTVYTFDGASCIYDAKGDLIAEAPAYQQTYLDIQNIQQLPATPIDFAKAHDNIENQFAALLYGSKTFLKRMGIRKLVIGVSGGIDSAVVTALMANVLSKDNLLVVNMPGPFTSSTTKNLARSLAENLDIPYAEFPIAASVDLTCHQLENTFFTHSGDKVQLTPSDFVKENIQARDRSSRVLAAVAASFGGAFTCNANKSEMTVGYSTLYGDLGGCLAPIADLWKGEVYELAAWLNEDVFQREVIPQGSINIVPSAELSAAQNVDQGQGDPLHYPYHDALFRSWVERWDRATPEDILRWYSQGTLEQSIGFNGSINDVFGNAQTFCEDLERWWNLYQGMAIAKRIQAPPIIAVKRRAFGFDHRESQLGPRYSTAYQQLKRALNIA